MEYFKYQINEDEWTIYLIDDHDNVVSDEDNAATTSFSDKEMFFRKGDINIQHIRHELWHVYFGYCYLGDTNNITIDDLEEISASLFGDKAEKIIERARYIEKQLIKLRDTKKKEIKTHEEK